MPAGRTQDKYTVCPISSCSKPILTKDMSRHQKTHAENREHLEYRCSQCGYRELQQTNVLDHFVRKHTNDRPHICGYLGSEPRSGRLVCNLAFSTSSGLSKHRKDAHGPNTGNMYAIQKGKLDKYKQYVLSPVDVARRAASTSSSSSSSSASSYHRTIPSSGLAPLAAPIGTMPASIDPYLSPAAMTQASLAQLATMHPTHYPYIQKDAPVDRNSYTGAYMPITHPGAWSAQQPLYGVQNAYSMQQAFAPMSQEWTYEHQAPRYGHSIQRQW